MNSSEIGRLCQLVTTITFACLMFLPAGLQAQNMQILNELLEGKSFEGRVEARRTAQVAQSVNGYLVGIHFANGDVVRSGQLLFELSSASHKAQLEAATAALARRRVELSIAQKNAERIFELESRGASTPARAEDAGFQLALAEIAVEEAKANLDLLDLQMAGTKITAPIGGRISAPHYNIGAYLKPETGFSLAEIAQLDPVVIAFSQPYELLLQQHQVHPQNLQNIFDSTVVSITLPTGGQYSETGKIVSSETEMNSDGTLTIWAEVPNPDGILLPGLPVKVSVRVSN